VPPCPGGRVEDPAGAGCVRRPRPQIHVPQKWPGSSENAAVGSGVFEAEGRAVTVDLICADSWLCNAGDVASALATANGLAERGVPACGIPHYRGRRTIIGGGDLLGAGPNADLFAPPGPHYLNAVSVRAEPGDLSYLQEYCYLSFRDHISAEKA